jgi:hypothetical protein
MFSIKRKLEEPRHPHLAKIPKKLLLGYPFSGRVSEENLACISCELDAIQEKSEAYDTPNQLRRWICIIVDRAHVDARELIEKAAQLGISNEVVFEAAVLLNRMDIVDSLSKDTNIVHVLQNTVTPGGFFHGALEHDNLAALQKLTDLFPKTAAKFFTSDPHLLHFAAVDGQIEILKWLETKIDPETIKDWIRRHNFEMFHKAAQAGHAEALTWIVEKRPENFEDMVGVVRNMGRESVGLSFLGRPEAAAAFNKQWDDMHSFAAFRSAVYEGHAPVLDWFKQRVSPQNLQCMIQACLNEFTEAAGYGRLGSIMWLEQEAPQTCQTLISRDQEKIRSTAEDEENATVLKWLEAKISGESAVGESKKEADSAAAMDLVQKPSDESDYVSSR